MSAPAAPLQALRDRLFPGPGTSLASLSAATLGGPGGRDTITPLFAPLLGTAGPVLAIDQIGAPAQTDGEILSFRGRTTLFGGRLPCAVSAAVTMTQTGAIALSLDLTPLQAQVAFRDLLCTYGLVPVSMTDATQLPATHLPAVTLRFDSAQRSLTVSSGPADFPLARTFAPLKGLLPDAVSLALTVSIDPVTRLKNIQASFNGTLQNDPSYAAQITFPLGLTTGWRLSLQRGAGGASTSSILMGSPIAALFTGLVNGVPDDVAQGLGLSTFFATFFPDTPTPFIYALSASLESTRSWEVLPGLLTLDALSLSCSSRVPELDLAGQLSATARFGQPSDDGFATAATVLLPLAGGILSLSASPVDDGASWTALQRIFRLDASAIPPSMTSLQHLTLDTLNLSLAISGGARLRQLAASLTYGARLAMTPAVTLQAGASLGLAYDMSGGAPSRGRALLSGPIVPPAGSTPTLLPTIAYFSYQDAASGWQFDGQDQPTYPTWPGALGASEGDNGDTSAAAQEPATMVASVPDVADAPALSTASELQQLYGQLFPSAWVPQQPVTLDSTSVPTLAPLFTPLLGAAGQSLVIDGIMSRPATPTDSLQFSGTTQSAFNLASFDVNLQFTLDGPGSSLALKMVLVPRDGSPVFQDLLLNYGIVPVAIVPTIEGGGLQYASLNLLSLPNPSFHFNSLTQSLSVMSGPTANPLASNTKKNPLAATGLDKLLPPDITLGFKVVLDQATRLPNFEIVFGGNVDLGSSYNVQLGVPLGLSSIWSVQIQPSTAGTLDLSKLPKTGAIHEAIKEIGKLGFLKKLGNYIELRGLYVSFFVEPKATVNFVSLALQTTKPWTVKSGFLTVDQVSLNLSAASASSDWTYYGQLQGQARIGKTEPGRGFDAAVTIPIPPNAGVITVSARSITIEKIWSILCRIFDVHDRILPLRMEALSSALTLSFIELQLQLDPPSLTSTALTLVCEEQWSLPWFHSVYLESGASLGLALQHSTAGTSLTYAVVEGTLMLGEIPIGVCLTQSEGAGWALAITSSGIVLPSISNLAAFVGGGVLENVLPSGIRDTGNFLLADIAISLEAKPLRLGGFSFLLTYSDTSPDWVLIPNYLSIDSFAISADLAPQPDGTHAFSGYVSGVVAISGERIRLEANKASAGDAWVFQGSTLEPVSVDLQAILAHFDLPSEIADLSSTCTLTLNTLSVVTAPETGAFSATVDIALSGSPWPFQKLSLDTIDFSISRTKQNLDVNVSGALTVDGASLALAAGYDSSSGWNFTGGLSSGSDIDVGSLITKFFPDLPQKDCDLTIDDLTFSATIDTAGPNPSKIYSFTVGGDWTISLANLDLGDLTIDATAKLVCNESTAVTNYDGSKVTGTLDFHGLSLTAGMDMAATERKYTFAFLGATSTVGQDSHQITFTLGNQSLGEMISMLVQAATGDSITLPEPWSALNAVQLNDFDLIFTAPPSGDHAVTLQCDIALNIEIADIQSINLVYDCSTRKVKVNLTGTFLGLPMDSPSAPAGGTSNQQAFGNWYADDPSTAPSVPGKGNKYFELNLLGLGQFVALPSATSTMNEALTELRDTFSSPGVPSTVHYDAKAGWLIATQFTVLDMIELSVLFNDPKLYGLLITVSKGKFNGLEFEILYKKINANVGVYYLKFGLPFYLRHLQFGAVSITLPDLEIWIYTNGGFKIDLGFPYNGDFSKSAGVQVLPFIGAGGFYFGVLHGQTSPQLPTITDPSGGNFNPVIVFGLGLEIGLGKSINEGPISAAIEVAVEGILEGTIAPYHSYNPAAGPGGDTKDTYYYLQAQIGIVGRVSGQLNLAIITATLNLVAQVVATAVIEAYRAIDLNLTVSATVEVAVRIDLWLFSITIHISFSFEVSEQFTLGDNRLGPWDAGFYSALPPSQYEPIVDTFLLGAADPLTVSQRRPINWRAPMPVGPPQPVQLYLAPKFTLATTPARQVELEALLVIDAPKSGAEEPTSFGNLAQALMLWTFNAILDPTAPLEDIRERELSREDLIALRDYFTQQQSEGSPHPIAIDDLEFFFGSYLDVGLHDPMTIPDPARQAFSVFPMLPYLKLVTPSATVDFSQPLCDAQYFQQIRATFENWA